MGRGSAKKSEKTLARILPQRNAAEKEVNRKMELRRRIEKKDASERKSGQTSEAPDSDYSDAEEIPRGEPMAIDSKTSESLSTQLKQQAAASKRSKVAPTPKSAGVLYLGHIPHGFYEDEMRKFFSQFGTISRLRLARNKKTGRSKHYAFIEFKVGEVASIVAKAMNGYMMYSRLLVARVVPPKHLHPETFKNADRKFKVIDRTAIERKKHNKVSFHHSWGTKADSVSVSSLSSTHDSWRSYTAHSSSNVSGAFH